MIGRPCTRCASPNIRKNGHTPSGRQKFVCKDCGFAGTLDLKSDERAARMSLVERLLTERLSRRAIARLTGVSRSTIIARLKKNRPSNSAPSASGFRPS
jgi:transposase-like protein